MKHLRKFATESDLTATPFPNAVLIEDTKKVLYNAVPFGVYIQHIDGNLYTTEEWEANGFANEVANGVAVVTQNAKFVMAPTLIAATTWSSDGTTLIEGVLTTSDKTEAKSDYAGKSNTDNIALTDTGGAAYKCKNYTFPNGAKGYLPSMGEVQTAYKNKSAINAARTLIGATALPTGGSPNLWSSTQADASNAWYMSWYNGTLGTVTKAASVVCAPFTTL